MRSKTDKLIYELITQKMPVQINEEFPLKIIFRLADEHFSPRWVSVISVRLTGVKFLQVNSFPTVIYKQ